MTDILFINPLGWDRYIWARVLENMPDQTFDFIEFTEESFKSISKKEIEQVLLNKMTRVRRGGYIITASYGTVVLLNGLEIFSEYLRKLRKEGSEYMVRPNSQTEYDYLSLYAGVDNLELLKRSRNVFNKLTVFSYFKLIGMNYTQIEESDHLLMVTKPKMILDILLGK